MEFIPQIDYRIFSYLLDIAIVAYLLNTLYTVIAGTRTMQALKGLSIIILAYLLGKVLGLDTFVWLYERGLEVAAFALVVLFQNEIRRIVMKLGENTPVTHFFSRREREILEILPAAVYNLSKQAVGALIVIVRKTGLKGYIENGIRLDAILTKELLESIFVPKCPLHDGAIIIDENRIAAAGCLLPLTDRTDLDKIFGTRHRAAIGLAEETDAVIVVVSEENGNISIAFESKLYYGLSPQKFEAKLKQFLYRPKADTLKSKWSLKNRFFTKLFANQQKTTQTDSTTKKEENANV